MQGPGARVVKGSGLIGQGLYINDGSLGVAVWGLNVQGVILMRRSHIDSLQFHVRLSGSAVRA